MPINTNTNFYGSELPRSPGQLTKSVRSKRFGFKFPMGDTDSGQFLKKSSDLDLVKGQLKQLLLTTRGERVMLPGFGTNLRRYLMEPLDQATFSQIKREILESFSRYAPNVGISKIQIFPGRTETFDGGSFLVVKLFCVLRSEQDVRFDIKVNIQ